MWNWFLVCLLQFFIDPAKLLPLARFLPKPPGEVTCTLHDTLHAMLCMNAREKLDTWQSLCFCKYTPYIRICTYVLVCKVCSAVVELLCDALVMHQLRIKKL